MLPIMTVSKVAKSGAVSYHILEGAAARLAVDPGAIVDAGDKGIQDAALTPL